MANNKVVGILALLGVFSLAGSARAQTAIQPLPALPAFSLTSDPGELSIDREAVPSRPFSVVGPRGAVLGQQDGSCEVWLFPWKILSNLVISADRKSVV